MRGLLVISLTLFLRIAASQQLEIEPIILETESAFRGMSVVDDHVIWLGGTKGVIGRSVDGAKHWKFTTVKGFEKADFRSVYAFDSLTAVIANAGSPAVILRTDNGGRSWRELYRNSHPDAFIDGVDFWNIKEGIFYGDAVRGKMLLIKTTDGGKTWNEIPEALRPEMKQGEGSFAASGTNIHCFPSGKTFIATGGVFSRLFVSDDKAAHFRVIEPPILQGEQMTGIFSMDFFNEDNGVLVGGNYNIDSLRVKHVLITKDGGQSWLVPAIPTGGIREAVVFLSNSQVVALGYPGIDISFDGGLHWKMFSQEKGYSVIRKARSGSLVVLAGNKKLSILHHGER